MVKIVHFTSGRNYRHLFLDNGNVTTQIGGDGLSDGPIDLGQEYVSGDKPSGIWISLRKPTNIGVLIINNPLGNLGGYEFSMTVPRAMWDLVPSIPAWAQMHVPKKPDTAR